MSIRIGIVGYGNLGRGVEAEIAKQSDLKAAAIFTRRNSSTVTSKTPGLPIIALSEVSDWVNSIDVMILCGGSATDLPTQTPELAKSFNVVDSFDTHALIPQHFAAVDTALKQSGRTGIISVGWDPGLFSVNRLYSQAILPNGQDETFWGRGVSQGHSDAIRRIPGVKDAKQYTIPIDTAVAYARAGKTPKLSTREKHRRECYVVTEAGADQELIVKQIKEMPHYFLDYDTTVHFIKEEILKSEHSGIPHGGKVIRTGSTGFDNENKQVIEFSLQLDSNPEFTASVLCAYARAAHRLWEKGETGCKTVFDIAPALLDPRDQSDLLKYLL